MSSLGPNSRLSVRSTLPAYISKKRRVTAGSERRSPSTIAVTANVAAASSRAGSVEPAVARRNGLGVVVRAANMRILRQRAISGHHNSWLAHGRWAAVFVAGVKPRWCSVQGQDSALPAQFCGGCMPASARRSDENLLALTEPHGASLASTTSSWKKLPSNAFG